VVGLEAKGLAADGGLEVRVHLPPAESQQTFGSARDFGAAQCTQEEPGAAGGGRLVCLGRSKKISRIGARQSAAVQKGFGRGTSRRTSFAGLSSRSP
jgi:hypothetical protein